MRARIMMMSGGPAARQLALPVQEVLSDLAVAFGHSFVIKEEKIGEDSLLAYGSPMTQEAIEHSADCDAVLVLSGSSRGVDALAAGLGCFLKTRIFAVPPMLAQHSLLKSSLQPSGTLATPLDPEEQAMRRAVDLVRDLMAEKWLPLREVPLGGMRRADWLQATDRFSVPQEDRLYTLPQALKVLVTEPASMGMCFVSPGAYAALDSTARALSGLYGMAPLCYLAEKPLVFGVDDLKDESQDHQPFGMLRAVADMLEGALFLKREADCLRTALDNVLNAGWRTADLSEPGLPTVTAEGICRLIQEQLSLVGELMQR